MRVLVLLLALLPVTAAPAQKSAVDRGRELQSESISAYRAGDYGSFLQLTRDALALRPNHPTLVYNAAAGHALIGEADQAIEFLAEYAQMGLTARVDQDADFSSIAALPAFERIRGRLERNAQSNVRSDPAFSVAVPCFFPEGIAYDPQTQSFFLSSVFQGKIIRVRNGEVRDFATIGGGRSPLGIAVDDRRRVLWVAASVVAEAGAARDSSSASAEDNVPSVLAFDLVSARLLGEALGGKFLGDIAIDPEGSVFVSDALGGMVYSLREVSHDLEPAVRGGEVESPQGVAFHPDGEILFVADYAQGILRVDRSTGDVQILGVPDDVTLLGIDGLAWSGRSLLAIQNGVRPQRLLLLELNAALTAVRSVEVLESAHPLYDEPTTGVIVDDAFFYVANGQWSKMERRDEVEVADPVVLRLKLAD